MLNWYILQGTRWFNQMHYLDDQTFAQTMTDNENMIMLPDNMFLNLIDMDLQQKIMMTDDLDGTHIQVECLLC